MKVLVFGVGRVYATNRILDELSKKGIENEFISHNDLVYTTKGILHKNKPFDVSDVDVVMFRTPGYTDDVIPFTFRLENEISLLMRLLKKNNIKIINEKLMTIYPFYNKFTQSQMFLEKGIPTVDTFHVHHNSLEHVLNGMKIMNFDFPFIIKESSGSQGENIFKINDEEQLGHFLYLNRSTNLVFQKFVKNNCDYRVIVCRSEVLGIMKRSANVGEWRNNFSLGGNVEMIQNDELKALSLDINEKMEGEYIGIDFIKTPEGKYVVLEINLYPGFEGFEKSKEANVALKIAELIESKRVK